MSEPVKLSRERWEMLRHAANPVVPSLWSVVLDKPLETHGVIFLPAEYVPDSYSTYDPVSADWVKHEPALRRYAKNNHPR